MRAWQVNGQGEPKDVLELCEGLESPAAQPGFLQLDVRCVGIGLPDVFMCRGSYALTPQLPFTPGQELVGIVTAVPEGAEHRVGDRVVGVSGFMLGRLVLSLGYPWMVGRALGVSMSDQLVRALRPTVVAASLVIVTMNLDHLVTANTWVGLVLGILVTLSSVSFLAFFTGVSGKQRKRILQRIRLK